MEFFYEKKGNKVNEMQKWI